MSFIVKNVFQFIHKQTIEQISSSFRKSNLFLLDYTTLWKYSFNINVFIIFRNHTTRMSKEKDKGPNYTGTEDAWIKTLLRLIPGAATVEAFELLMDQGNRTLQSLVNGDGKKIVFKYSCTS